MVIPYDSFMSSKCHTVSSNFKAVISTIDLDEMKHYLRVDFDDDDVLIESLIENSKQLCADIARLSVDELSAIPSSKIAVMYAVAYLYEHREDADHHQLSLSLRSLLEGVRRSVF